jgi:hypothetical protein
MKVTKNTKREPFILTMYEFWMRYRGQPQMAEIVESALENKYVGTIVWAFDSCVAGFNPIGGLMSWTNPSNNANKVRLLNSGESITLEQE